MTASIITLNNNIIYITVIIPDFHLLYCNSEMRDFYKTGSFQESLEAGAGHASASELGEAPCCPELILLVLLSSKSLSMNPLVHSSG